MKKPIALLVTDTHLKESNINLVTNIWQQAIDQCHKLEIDQIFFLGDFFDSRKGQPLTVLKAGQRIVENLLICGIGVKAIVGNHSKQSYDSPDSYLDIYNSSYFEVFNEYEYHLDYKNELNLHFLSYFNEKNGSYLDRLRSIEIPDNKFKNILLTHIAINGSITNDNEHISNCIPSSEFEKFDLICSGHFHARQEFENIVYIGSAYQSNYGEDSNKGFTILYDDGSYEFTKSKFPEYRKYSMDISNLEESEILGLSKEKEEGHNIRVELVGNGEQLKSFNRSILSDLGIDSVLKPHGAIESLEDCNVTSHDKESIRDAFKSFCEEIKIEQTDYAIEKLEEI